jgi:Cd2+/Zn2+-exporting ATPase
MQVDQVARVYTPLVVVSALLAATLPWAFFPPAQAQQILYQALVLLVVACPCALVISTPITYVCALASAASQGILIKGGVHLETLAGAYTHTHTHTPNTCMHVYT